MLYFAYGSNMDWKRMKERCPTAKFVATASLQKHKLAFTKKATSGKFQGYGVADLVESPENTVWGVVFQIDEVDLGKLDKAEGYNPNNPNTEGYKREERRVLDDGKEDRPLTVLTYVVQKKAESEIPPAERYLQHILDGAGYWHLPEQYIQELEAIKTKT